MIKFFAVIGVAFCMLFLGIITFGCYLSVATYVEKRRAEKRNQEEGNLKITADKPHRFKKN